MKESDTNPRHAVAVADWLDGFILRTGNIIAWAYVALVLVIMTQVILRKGFSGGLIALEEVQWHLYAIGVMFGISYAQVNNAHVRVDIFYSGFSQRTKWIVDILGILLLVLPFIYVIFIHSIDFVMASYRVNEGSNSPSGLPWRWAIKAVIPISFAFFGLAVISRLIRNFTLLFKGEN